MRPGQEDPAGQAWADPRGQALRVVRQEIRHVEDEYAKLQCGMRQGKEQHEVAQMARCRQEAENGAGAAIHRQDHQGIRVANIRRRGLEDPAGQVVFTEDKNTHGPADQKKDVRVVRQDIQHVCKGETYVQHKMHP